MAFCYNVLETVLPRGNPARACPPRSLLALGETSPSVSARAALLARFLQLMWSRRQAFQTAPFARFTLRVVARSLLVSVADALK